LQHRVKNSFLMIMSMIELSQKSLSDSDSSTVLNEIHARISAIAEMYNLLYQSESLNSIRLDLYLAKIVLLTTNLHTNINIESNFEELKCNSDIAIPAGIITTELLTNAIKYAYEAEEKKPIRFSLGLRKNSAIITVSDKGRGLPEDYNLDDPPTLGFKLIKSLAEQIDGKFKVKSGRGTTCSLKFDI
jgi:two-component system, sensor histidine kinase PdtaS